jgi:pimeloyl-ACP methyl ester carboxylesterase
VLSNWDRRSRFFLEAIERFDEARRGDPHWLSIQFMRTMHVDRLAASLLLKAHGDHPEPERALAAIKMRSLVVCGSEDDENGSARELSEALPNAEYREIPGTHMSSVTKPDLGEEIARFLAQSG